VYHPDATWVLLFGYMPTRYRRVNVTLDPQLSDALKLAGERLRARTDAGRLRELALIGVRTLGTRDAQLEELGRELDELGATPARGDLLVTARRLRKRAWGQTDETASESLEWVRGDR